MMVVLVILICLSTNRTIRVSLNPPGLTSNAPELTIYTADNVRLRPSPFRTLRRNTVLP